MESDRICRECRRSRPEVSFGTRPNGCVFTRCRDCSRLWVLAYRKTAKYKLWLGRSREKRRLYWAVQRKTPSNVARLRRYHEQKTKLDPAAQKYRNLLTEAIEKKLVKKPSTCADCSSGLKLRAFFHRGRRNYLDVVFVCFSCFNARLRAENAAIVTKERRLTAPLRRDHSVEGRRRLFLRSICGYTKGEANDIIAKEGPMECLLGCWLSSPSRTSARARSSGSSGTPSTRGGSCSLGRTSSS
jgi:hypothetical protein